MGVKIFTEGGGSIGLGHISRCCSLYDEIIYRGVEVELIIYGDIKNVDILKGYTVKNINWLSEEYLSNNIQKNDFCIVDSYLASKNFYNIISNKSKKAIYIDDNARIKYPKGIIVNPSFSIDGLNYQFNDGSKYLFGSKYIILRKSFIGIERENQNKDVKEVLIIMGGTDIRDLTPKIINTICRKYPKIVFNIIIGNTFKNIKISESIKDYNIILYYNLDACLMKNLMVKSDFAISAAGQTIFELLATNTPFIPIKIIENQVNNINGLRKINPELVVIDYEDQSMLKQIENEFNLMLDIKKRIAFTQTFYKIVDGFGSKRIINELLSE